MDKSYSSWSSFKSDMIARSATNTLQYDEYLEGANSRYILNFLDGVLVGQYILYHSDTESKTDFDTNYKSGANKSLIKKDVFGFPVMTPALDTTGGLYPVVKTYKFSVQPNTINIFDLEVTTEIRIVGGEIWVAPSDVSKVHDDDYCEFSIVDKNNVLGLFSVYGIPQGGVLELKKFVRTEYIKKGDADSGYNSVPGNLLKGSNPVLAGLFRRITYESFGSEALTFIVRLTHYE